MINYNEISKIYDDVRAEEVGIIERFLNELKLIETSKILDVGCGTGNYTNLIERVTKCKVYGLDASVGMLEKARVKNEMITFVEGSAIELPFLSNEFDFIYMTDVIHHIKDVTKMFNEFHRVLKQNGKLCIVTQSHKQIDARYMSEFFPQTAIVDKKRYPDIGEIISKTTNLIHLKTETVHEGIDTLLDHKYLELIEKKGYSMLHLIDVTHYQDGLKKVKGAIGEKRKAVGTTLVWFIK